VHNFYLAIKNRLRRIPISKCQRPQQRHTQKKKTRLQRRRRRITVKWLLIAIAAVTISLFVMHEVRNVKNKIYITGACTVGNSSHHRQAAGGNPWRV
jgi:hypothetical protein